MSTAPRILRLVLLGLWPVLGGTAYWLARPSNDERTQSSGPPSARQQERPARVADSARVPPFVNPFRLDRQIGTPSRVATVVERAPEREPFKLTGIVWGTPPSAIIEGLAGAEGPVVLRQGDERFGVRVLRVVPAAVTLLANGATWHLRLNSIPGIGR